ncbi:hypothetical protein MJ575_12285 [Klebsiella pneumoniae]|nr:hypothetical protein MJ575_12285 [Klebsiella pneumoniae]
MLDSYILLGGSGATLGLIIAIFITSRRADHRPELPSWRCRRASSRLTNRFCLVCRSS